MNYPSNPECKRVYRWIEAHCMKRLSAKVGAELRAIAGSDGNIGAINLALVGDKVSCPNEARRLIALAKATKRRAGSEGNHGE